MLLSIDNELNRREEMLRLVLDEDYLPYGVCEVIYGGEAQHPGS